VTRARVPAARPLPAEPLLTERQREVWRLIALGLKVPAIGRQLGRSENTLKSQLTVIYRCLGVWDRNAAVTRWMLHEHPAAEADRVWLREHFAARDAS